MTTTAPTAGPAEPRRRPAFALQPVALAIAINAIPIVGVLFYGWSGTNVLVLYWLENLMLAVATSIRLALHRKLTRKKGYWRTKQIGLEVNGEPVKAGFLGEYMMTAFGFTLAHGVFVAVIVVLFAQKYPDDPMWQLSLPDALRGAAVMAAVIAVELGADLGSIRTRSFAAMKDMAQARLGRVLILHLAIIFGMAAMAMADSPFGVLYVLIGLKAIVDIASAATRHLAPVDAAPVPPAWMLKSADRLARDKGGAKGFLEEWQRRQDEARRNAIEDEKPMTG